MLMAAALIGLSVSPYISERYAHTVGGPDRARTVMTRLMGAVADVGRHRGLSRVGCRVRSAWQRRTPVNDC